MQPEESKNDEDESLAMIAKVFKKMFQKASRTQRNLERVNLKEE